MDKKLWESGQAPNQQEVVGIGPSAQSTRSCGNRAKRPMDKKLWESGQAPNRQELGVANRNNLGKQAKRPIDKKLGEQAKRPINKNSEEHLDGEEKAWGESLESI
ncbi:MAG: hypothetical protein RBU37_03350 [Myxococcota bacterium]|jgi:hypothetical protein|nr:hypothetical protein [Myxococcota bacterium]